MEVIYPDDNALWYSLKNGDENAFQALFKRYYSQLFLYGVKITQDKELLEDCIQELFIEIWSSKTVTQIQSIKAYLIKSLQYKIYKKVKTNKLLAAGEHHFPEMPFELTKETLIVEGEENKMRAKRIENMVARLSNRQREIIYLRFFRNMSYEEISEIMEINYQVSRNLLSQALKALRDIALLAFLAAMQIFS